MAAITQTVVETTTVSVAVTTATETATLLFATTITATPGQTITVAPPCQPLAAPTGWYNNAPELTQTLTDLQMNVFLENANGNVYSDWFTEVQIFQVTPIAGEEPVCTAVAPVFVVENPQHGWNAWSIGAKEGLIIGLICALIMALSLLLYLRGRRKVWLAHQWPFSTAPVVPAPQPHFTPHPALFIRGGAGRSTSQRSRFREHVNDEEGGTVVMGRD